jgi:DNA (cytosine-5)-methyltransferase 1
LTAYYTEIDPYAAQWLRNLIAAGYVAPGDVDERSIVDVRADDLRGYTQAHFFAGIGGWSVALRLAGWPDDRPVWTGSCPCQPYSIATVGHGGAKGHSDERDLWSDFFGLIEQREPDAVFGEQVPAAIGWGWWDRAAMDLEGKSYACAALVLRADAAEADHERKRLYWLADSGSARRQGHQPIERISVAEGKALAIYGNPLARARAALGGDYSGLLSGDGVSVAVERCATKGYGNAIVPQVAAEFIRASMSTISESRGGVESRHRCVGPYTGGHDRGLDGPSRNHGTQVGVAPDPRDTSVTTRDGEAG